MKIQLTWEQIKENKYLFGVAQELIKRKNRSSLMSSRLKAVECDWTLYWTEQFSIVPEDERFKNIVVSLRLSFGTSWWESPSLTSLPESVLALVAKEIEKSA